MDIEATFASLDIQQVEAYKAQQQEENLYLDFKLVDDASLSKRDDRNNLAKAISGFANSSGGLIVWGVDARKSADGIDCVSALPGIANVARLISRLNELTGEAVDPIVSNVRHRAIAAANGKGFAVTIIPESDVGPHMAKLGEDRYYKRSGDSFYRMEHFDIADMFGRRRRPKLALTARPRGRGLDATIIIGLRNDGRASARAAYLAFSVERPFFKSNYGLDGNLNEGMRSMKGQRSGYAYQFGEDTNFTIHPGVEHQVTLLHLGVLPKNGPEKDVEISYAIACEDQPLETGIAMVPLSEIS